MLKVGDMLLIVNRLLTDQLLQVGQRWTSQWEWFHRPIHVVAHILHPSSHHPLGNISHELQDGWKSYLNIHCYDTLDENALDDELLKFLWKEGPFAREDINLQNPHVDPCILVGKIRKTYVPKLQALALHKIVIPYVYFNWSCFNFVQIIKQNKLIFYLILIM
jgi:hypothetical protein